MSLYVYNIEDTWIFVTFKIFNLHFRKHKIRICSILDDFRFARILNFKNSQIKNCYDLDLGWDSFRNFSFCWLHGTLNSGSEMKRKKDDEKKTKTYLVRCQSLTDGSMSFLKASQICNESVVLSSHSFQLSVNVASCS